MARPIFDYELFFNVFFNEFQWQKFILSQKNCWVITIWNFMDNGQRIIFFFFFNMNQHLYRRGSRWWRPKDVDVGSRGSTVPAASAVDALCDYDYHDGHDAFARRLYVLSVKEYTCNGVTRTPATPRCRRNRLCSSGQCVYCVRHGNTADGDEYTYMRSLINLK